VENGVAVEIDKRCLRRILLDDFHQLLGKASAKNASALPHLPQPRRQRLTIIHSASQSISRSACTKLCGKTLQSMGRSQHASCFDHLTKRGAVFAVPIMQQVPLDQKTRIFHRHIARHLFHPFLIGMDV
jgi:hypothetical protein